LRRSSSGFLNGGASGWIGPKYVLSIFLFGRAVDGVLKWDWVIRIEDRVGKPSWCEFSVSDIEGGVKGRTREPVQLSLFDALTDLDQSMDTLKKSVGRLVFEIERAFGKSG
jgi:hypothetical protein